MKKNNKGIALVNIILLIFIIVCIGFIAFIMLNNDSTNIADVNDIDSGYQSRNTIKRPNNNTNNNTLEENVPLSNNIGSGGVVSTANEGKKYYYNQLNSIGKSLYDTLIKNVEDLKTGRRRIEFDTKEANAGQYIQSTLDALSLDRPDIFWMDILKISFSTKTATFLTHVDYSYYLESAQGEANYLIDSFQNEDEVNYAISLIDAKVNDIVSRAQGSTYDKVKLAHDELVKLIEYDRSLGKNSSNIYGAFVEKTCVCEGYAEALKVVLDKLNIPCVIVYGKGIDAEGNTEEHAWNYVKMDNGNWYAIDTTWDDPIIYGNVYSSSIDNHKYFLKGSRSFLQSHKPDGDVSDTGHVFEYPTLSEVDY